MCCVEQRGPCPMPAPLNSIPKNSAAGTPPVLAWLPKGEAVPAAPKGEGVEAPKGEAPAEADPPAEADAPKGDELRDAPSNGEGALVEALAASWPTILSIPRLKLGSPAR